MADDRGAAAFESSEPSRRVIHGTMTFALASVLQRAAPLLLLPLFAQILTPDEFGQIGVILTLTAALSTIAGLGLETAVFRGYLRAASDPSAIRPFINTVGAFGILTPTLMAVAVVVLLGPWLSDVFDLPIGTLFLGAVAAAANASATAVPLAILRAQEQLRTYLALTSVQVIVTAGLTVLFVAVFDLGVLGWMLASAAAALLLLVRGIASMKHRWTRELDLTLLGTVLAFGLPLMPHALAHWGLAVSDRAILGAQLPSGVVGGYYVAYLFVLPISLVSIALSQAMQPLYATAASGEAREGLSRFVTVQVAAILFSGAAVATLGPALVELMLPSGYGVAAEFIPWLAAGASLFGLYLIPMSAVALLAGHTARIWVITVIAAATNIGLNLIFVPRFGAMSAAVNTTIGYGVLLLGVFVLMMRVARPPIPYERGRILASAALIAVITGVAAIISPPSAGLAFALRGTLLLVLAILLGTVGPLRSEAQTMLRYLRPVAGRMH